jgi:hypothetical protein
MPGDRNPLIGENVRKSEKMIKLENYKVRKSEKMIW